MCVVSMIHDWASKLPTQTWDPNLLDLYHDLLRRVNEIDAKLGLPNCESPEKAAFLKEIEERVKKLEEKVNPLDEDTALAQKLWGQTETFEGFVAALKAFREAKK